MKRLDETRRRWLFVRARREAQSRQRKKGRKPLLVRIWDGEEITIAISERQPSRPPNILCFEDNFVDTVDFLATLRRKLLSAGVRPVWLKRGRDRNMPPRLMGFTDFAVIERISTAAALVLAAEYERAVAIVGAPPPLVNLDSWRDTVFQRLWQLGFFPLLGLGDRPVEGPLEIDEDVLTLRFLSGSNAEEAEQADEMLQQLATFIDPNQSLPEHIALPLNSALSEAMVNVRMHAYPTDYRFQYRHVRRWWLSGSANRHTRTLTVAIYDQGASIPVTYRRLAALDHIRSFIAERLPTSDPNPFAADAVHIEAAVRYGSSQTGKSYRGKGLPQMHEAVDACGTGRLTIISRGGRYRYSGPGLIERSTVGNTIGGTLIEWTVTLPSVNEDL